MTLSVIIPTFRRPAELRRCLEALLRQQTPPAEVLVGVRSDDAATRQALARWPQRGLPLQVVAVGLTNASVARNRCVDRARGDILVLIDDDTVPHPDFLERIQAHFEADPALGGIGGPDWIDGKVVPVAARATRVGALRWWGRWIGGHHRGTATTMTVAWLKGANMSFRRGALGDLRFGDTLRGDAAQFGEDIAVSLAVTRKGWRLLYDPAVAVDHYPGALAGGRDHRGLADHVSLSDAAHNDTGLLLDHLSPIGRIAAMAYAVLVGTRLLPGVLMGGLLLLSRGSLDGPRRAAIVVRARWERWRGWRAAAGQVAVPGHPGMRVGIVTHVVHPRDGQGRVNYALTRHLLAQGHHVTLFASEVDPALQRAPNLAWVRIPVPRRAPDPIRWLLFALQVPLRLGRGARDRFDILHLHGAIAPVTADVNTCHFVHASWRRMVPATGGTWRERYQRAVTASCTWCERRAYRSATRVVAVSEVVRTALMEDAAVPARRIQVIATGVDLTEFRPRTPADPRVLRAALQLTPDHLLVVLVGDAVSPRKNVDLVLRAVARAGDQVHLAVIGRSAAGPYPALAAELGIAGRAHFLGIRPDVAECLRDADVAVCPSHYEPASLVLLEAMATGLPVMTTPGVGNAVFVVDGANGFVLRDRDDLEGAVRALQLLRDDAALRARLGRAARATAATLDWTRMGRQYEELYAGLAGERHRGASRRVESTTLPSHARQG